MLSRKKTRPRFVMAGIALEGIKWPKLLGTRNAHIAEVEP